MILELIKEDAYSTTNQIAEFAKSLQGKYPDYHDYRLYCVMIGSTPVKECSKFDFPNEDSVENFLESLRESVEKGGRI